MRILGLLAFILICYSSRVTCQVLPDSTDIIEDIGKETKSEKVEDKFTFRTLFAGEPGKSFYYSLLLPGIGQIRNKSYWKLPLVWGAFGTAGYFIFDNNKKFNRYNDAFVERVDLDEMSTDEFINILSLSQINEIRQYHRKNLQRSYISLGLIYFLTAAEAFVDSHLMHFDMNDDLTLNIDWQILDAGNIPSLGLQCSFSKKDPVFLFLEN